MPGQPAPDTSYGLVLSDSETLAHYLTTHLPEFAAVCDQAGDDGWRRFRRLGNDVGKATPPTNDK